MRYRRNPMTDATTAPPACCRTAGAIMNVAARFRFYQSHCGESDGLPPRIVDPANPKWKRLPALPLEVSIMENDTLLGIVFSSICGCGLVGAIGFLVIGTIFKLPFGVNLGRAECGECGRAAPTVRAPKDLYEMLLGEWTCGKCGCKNDK